MAENRKKLIKAAISLIISICIISACVLSVFGYMPKEKKLEINYSLPLDFDSDNNRNRVFNERVVYLSQLQRLGAGLFQRLFAVFLSKTQNALAHPVGLYFQLAAGKNMLNHCFGVGANGHGFPDKIGSVPLGKLPVVCRKMIRIRRPLALSGSPGPLTDKCPFFRENLHRGSRGTDEDFLV